VKFVTEILAKNLAIHNPLSFNGSNVKGNFGGTLAWFVRFYPREEIILTKDGFNSLRGEYLQSQQKRTDKEGPYYCIDLANAPAMYEAKFKGIGRHSWDHYAMIVDGLGRGLSCAWGSGKGQLLNDRKTIIEGGHVTGMTDSAEDELKRVSTPSEVQVPKVDILKSDGGIIDIDATEIETSSDFLPSVSPSAEIKPLHSVLSAEKCRLVKSLITAGQLGKGTKSDVEALKGRGITLEDLFALSDNEKHSLGLSVVNNEIRFLR